MKFFLRAIVLSVTLLSINGNESGFATMFGIINPRKFQTGCMAISSLKVSGRMHGNCKVEFGGTTRVSSSFTLQTANVVVCDFTCRTSIFSPFIVMEKSVRSMTASSFVNKSESNITGSVILATMIRHFVSVFPTVTVVPYVYLAGMLLFFPAPLSRTESVKITSGSSLLAKSSLNNVTCAVVTTTASTAVLLIDIGMIQLFTQGFPSYIDTSRSWRGSSLCINVDVPSSVILITSLPSILSQPTIWYGMSLFTPERTALLSRPTVCMPVNALLAIRGNIPERTAPLLRFVVCSSVVVGG